MNTAQRLLAPYRVFLREPDVLQTLLIGFLARMPVGITGLALVMYLRDAYHSFQTAGTIIGVYYLAAAFTAPVLGRIIDRSGPKWPLRITGIFQPISFALLIAVVWYQGPLWAVYLCAVGMGVLAPPISVLTRTLWRHRFVTEHDRRLAFSIDSVLIELNFTLGPALVALILAFANSLQVILVTWAILVLAILAFFRTPALKYWRQEPPTERHWLGPLTDPQLLLLFVIVFGTTTACGLIEVGYPAWASAEGVPAFAGVLLSVNAFASALGGALYGALHFRFSLERQLALTLVLFGVPLMLHGPIDHHMVFLGIAFLTGFAISPAFTSQTLIVSRIAPPKYATEAFTWSSTVIVCGIGFGMALAGVLHERFHTKAPFVFGGALLLVMAALALLLHARQERG